MIFHNAKQSFSLVTKVWGCPFSSACSIIKKLIEGILSMELHRNIPPSSMALF